MKKYILTITISLIAICKIYSQNLVDSNLIGTWKVTNFELISNIEEFKANRAQLQLFKESLLKSEFEFKVDNQFNFMIDIKEMQVKNKLWKLNSSKNIISVTDAKNKKSKILEILVSVKNDKTYFTFLETPFKLEVIKQ